MDNINDRILLICKKFNISKASELAKILDITHQSATNYIKGKQKPNYKALQKIKLKFDNLNAEWLLTGDGEMLDIGNKSTSNENLEDLIKLQREKIQSLEKEIIKLKNQAKAVEKTV